MPEEYRNTTLPAKDQKAQQLNTHFDKFAPDHLSSRQQLCYNTTPACRNFLPWRGKSMSKYTALTYCSSGHSINKTTWKDAECRIPLKLISASPSATLSCPRFLAEEARSNSFLPQRQKAEAVIGSSATTEKRKGNGALGSTTQESSSSLTATKGLGNTKV